MIIVQVISARFSSVSYAAKRTCLISIYSQCIIKLAAAG